jgi:hypothetical protein
MNGILMNNMNVVIARPRRLRIICLLLMALAAAGAAGCGGHHKGASTPAGTPAARTTSETATTVAGDGEEQAPSIVYDYAASADCLDQYSGAYGDSRGRDGAALVYVVRVPEDETEESDTGVRLIFYKTAELAQRHVHDPGGYLSPAEKRVIGNVIVDGAAVHHPYAMELVTACLKF